MFNKTRMRLVIVNCIVFLLILTCFGSLLYIHMQYRLYQQSDEGLFQTERKIMKLGFEDLHPELDIGTAYLFWNAQGELTAPFPKHFVPPGEIYRFKEDLKTRVLRTVSYNGQSYRLLQIPNSNKKGTGSGEAAGEPIIAAVTLVRSLEAEERMLNTLRRDILTGIAAGVVISVLAGYFLAGRAFVPIRRSWEKQQQFVTDASHELRTPTSVIQAQTELLFRHPNHTIEQESQNIANILKESKRMGKLIDDLLTLARSDSNQLQIRTSGISLGPLLEDIAFQFRYLADIKEVEIRTRIQEPVLLWGDEERIRQLLVILLDNALKFTPAKGLIEIDCRKNSHSIQLSVQDTGCGIPEEEISHIFERFYRVDKTRSREDGGTGLGLSIAKWIVEAHGGEISAQSEPNAGTKINIWFPAKKPRDGEKLHSKQA
ncbi:MAG: sensor histidine kinase [Paenibacillus sp.]|jgi:signal transduction histidine kinase|nr:sensor histidine kinase [Paenibacillus sp.]